MNKIFTFTIIIWLLPVLLFAQLRNDAGSIGGTSGFFEANEPINFPPHATAWWHLLDVRHSNSSNLHAMQFSGSFFDQFLYFRKTNNNSGTAWSRVLLETDGKAKLDGSLHFGYLDKLGLNWGYNSDLASLYYTNTSNGNGKLMLDIGDDNLSTQSFQIRGARYDGIIAEVACFQAGGNVGIGTTTPRERLSVNGNIRAQEVKIETTNWPDYVFQPDYDLKPLSEVSRFIKENGHLPDVPKATVVEEEGVSLGEMNKILLKKVEELTLHLIEKDRKFSELENRVKALEVTK